MRRINLHRSARPAPARRPARPARLAVESLESRELLSATPYLVPLNAGVTTQTILTVGDSVNGYRMVGKPDGLGAFDNGDGTFTLLMDHELGGRDGVVRAHGAAGAFVSRWVINKADLTVVSGADLMQQVYLWNSALQISNVAPSQHAFTAFCSADLAPESAYFFDPDPNVVGDEVGTTARIFLHGEEAGNSGWLMASVATGPDAGNSYALGKFNLSTNGSGLTGVGGWENGLANPFAQAKTLVVANNDGGTGLMAQSLVVYVGNKTKVGTEADKAGLTNGVAKFINVVGHADGNGATIDELNNTTTRTTGIASGTRFTLGQSTATTFSRPEDGAWNPLNPREYYFTTTDRIDQVSDKVGTQIGRTRLWRLTFDDLTNPDAGGKIDLLIDGRTVNGQKVNMLDNITVNQTTGHLIIQEDAGGPHNSKIWAYNPNNGAFVPIARHDPARFGDVGRAPTTPFPGATAPLATVSEESSGVLDVSHILGAGTYLLTDMSGYAINNASPHGFANPNELVAGGQLLIMRVGNLAPTVAADTARATEDRALSVGPRGVLGNDVDFEGNPMTAAVVTRPRHGFLFLRADGSYAYTPYRNYHGPDSFTYRVTDSQGSSSVAAVSINVLPVNDAPVNRVPTTRVNVVRGSSRTISGLSVSDVDAGFRFIRVTLTVLGSGTVRIGSGPARTTLVLTGSQATINRSLRSLIFRAGPTAGTTRLGMLATDLGQFGSGGAKTDTDLLTIKIL